MRQSADSVAFAAARRMLDEIVVADALAPGRVYQSAHGLKLMVARMKASTVSGKIARSRSKPSQFTVT
jgi:hypothetical protein